MLRRMGLPPPGWVLAGALVGAALPALRLGFVHDDRVLLEGNPLLADTGNLWTALQSDLFWLARGNVRPSPYWRPWVVLGYFWDHFWGGGAAFAYHVTNSVLYVLLGLLAWWFAGRGWRAVLPVLLVMLHPAMVEPLANITARTDLWVAVWGTLSLCASGPLAFLALALALASKETAVILPWLWVLRDKSVGKTWRESVRSALPAGVLAAAWLLLRRAVVGGRGEGPSARGLSEIPARLGHYVQWLVWPDAGPTPDLDLYSLPAASPAAGMVIAVCTALLGVLVARPLRQGPAHAALAVQLVLWPLLLVSGLVSAGIRHADGFLAWPLVAVAALLARLPTRAHLGLVAVVMGLAVGHSARVAAWTSPETLWQAAVAAHPTDARILLKAARVDLALDPARARERAAPATQHPDPRFAREGHEVMARAILLAPPSESASWRPHLRAAADPNDPEAAWACATRCVLDDAPVAEGEHSRMTVCQAAVVLGEAWGDVWNTLGLLYAGQGDLRAARQMFANAVQSEPDRVAFQNNLAEAELSLQ